MTPAQMAARAADPAVAAAADDFSAAALLFCAHPEVFGQFQAFLIEAEPDAATWLIELMPDDLAAFAAIQAPEGAA